MRATVLDEPELEFANGSRHVDPRHGVADYGPVDAGTRTAPSKIEIGIVGPPDGVEGVRAWLDACREPIAPKSPNKYPKLFRDFPGFNEDAAFRSSLVFDDGLTRVISTRDLNRVTSKPGTLASAAAVELYADAVADLADTNRCRVILCARPDDLDEHGDRRRAEDDEKDASSIEVDTRKVDFHDLLKSRTIHHRTPMQLIRSTTWNPKRNRSARSKRRRSTPLQDEATRAWNLHTALYYKARGVPWRLVRSASDLTSLFVGVSFFHPPDRAAVHTSVAQLFNERGDGIVVRGGPAARSKDDRQPHLEEADAHDLLARALDVYRNERGNLPARVVMHVVRLQRRRNTWVRSRR